MTFHLVRVDPSRTTILKLNVAVWLLALFASVENFKNLLKMLSHLRNSLAERNKFDTKSEFHTIQRFELKKKKE